jgi:hypothetical protein
MIPPLSMHLDFLGIIYEKASCVKYYSIIFSVLFAFGCPSKDKRAGGGRKIPFVPLCERGTIVSD